MSRSPSTCPSRRSATSASPSTRPPARGCPTRCASRSRRCARGRRGARASPVYEMEGYEADDVIATLVGQAEALDLDTTILTGDLDMLQLVSERTKLLVSLRGGIANTVPYDLARIDERWGLRPDQMLDYKALKGDPTDNIPGVPGVGEKTAAKVVGAIRHARRDVRRDRRGPAREAARQAASRRRRSCSRAASSCGSCATSRSRSTSTRRASATTTARRSSGSSASTSSAP